MRLPRPLPGILACAVAGLLLLDPGVADAFKPKTHLWVAQQVLNDVLPDGKVSIGLGEYRVDPALVAALRAHPDEYRMGHIGPDAFPDVVVGQMTAHPGLPDEGGWPTDRWLEWMVARAGDDPRNRAFAYGYLGHAAGDLFAHSYVNWYSGGVFALFDSEPYVEIRHSALEAYIEHHTPPLRNAAGVTIGWADSLATPTKFVRDNLILSDSVAEQYRRVGVVGTHLVRMFELYQALGGLERELNASLSTPDARERELRRQVAAARAASAPPRFARGRAGGRAAFVPAVGRVPSDVRAFGAAAATADSLAALLAEHRAARRAEVGEAVGLVRAWRGDIRAATEAYVAMSHEVMVRLVRGQSPQGEVIRWLACWGYVLGGLSPHVGGAACTLYKRFAAVKTLTSKLLGTADLVEDPQGRISSAMSNVRRTLVAAGLSFSKLVLTDQQYVLVSLLALEADSTTLTDLFRTPVLKGTLLPISDVGARLNREMHLNGGPYFDPDSFPPAHNAVVLAKLSLLGPEELNRLVREHGGPATTLYGDSLYAARPGRPFNVLFGAVRSIDGSDQWQEYARGYLRVPRTGVFEACNPTDSTRRFGYAFSRERGEGMRLWADENVRRAVFARIFIGPLNPGIDTPTLLGFSNPIPPGYPYLLPTPADPFPPTQCRP